MQNTAAPTISLHEYLIQQVHLMDILGAVRSSFLADMRDRGLSNEEIVARVRDIADFLIYNLNSNGYLPYSIEEMVEAYLAQRDGDDEGSEAVGPDATASPLLAATAAGEPNEIGEVTVGPVAATAMAAAAAQSLENLESWAARSTAPAQDALETVSESPAMVLPVAEATATVNGSVATELETAGNGAPPTNNGSGEVPWTAETREALRIVQTLEPPGVGGRDLKEVLLLQIDSDPRKFQFERKLIEDHLEDIQSNRLPKVAKALGTDVERVKEGLEFLTMLNPRPGSLFAPKTSRYIIPDVVIDEIDGEYEVRLEDTYIPRLHISPHYRRMLTEQGDDPKVREFIKKKLESAKWLIESIEQRQTTLMRIVREIVTVQRPFFDLGLEHLKPLKMQHIADRVGVHVSTVSRALSDKYVQSPRGIYPLKFFFTGGTVSSDGTMKSTVSVKQKVKDIVDREDKGHPLSDEDIAKTLRIKQGLEIARRTVTKYRKQLGIPSSRQRREY